MKRIALFIAIAIAAIACKPEEQIVPEVTVHTDEATLVIPTEGGDVQIAFDANVEWTASLKEATAADWCTITPSSGAAGSTSLKVIALENTTNDNRVVTVVITAQTAKKEVKVTQLQKDALVLSGEKTFEVAADGGQVKFAVNHNIAVEAKADADWLVQAATRAMQTSEFTFDVAANTGAARTAKITVTAGDLKEELTVNQAAWAPVFEVAPAEDQWIAVEGGSVSITVDANVEYTVTTDENDWLTVTNEGGVYTFTAAANEGFDYRSTGVYVTPKDEAYVESAKAFYVFQNGRAAKLWAKHPAEDYEGYDASQRVKLAKYGDYILLANTTKIYVLNPADGSVVNTIDVPAGMAAHNVLVDDAGNVLFGADALDGAGDVTLYYVADPFNPEPEQLISWNAGNYYCVGAGNIRVKGNVKDDAVITAVVTDGAGGACIAWEVVDGVIGDWKWTNPPYTNWNVPSLCFAPIGATMADGFFYIGYGGDYNLYYTDSFVAGGGTPWAVSYVTGSSWMENYNCIATAEWNGNKYAAVVAGCHFDYDAADVFLLNVNNPAAAEHVYTHHGDGDADWDWTAGVNPNWTGLGTYSDVLLVPTADALLMVYVDSNYGAMACVAIK
ncbi:MAG: BACON domain-containing protein [Bacteroidales bacterium]|nr:BACON domain-containing protein [Bacteroidales bacterium]